MNVEDMDQRALAEQADRHRVENLLGRYPQLSLEEEAFVLRFLKRGPEDEIARLTANRDIKPQLDRFCADHAREFRVGPGKFLLALTIVAAVVAAVVLLWEVSPAVP